MGRAAGVGVNELALFAGAGGGILAGKLLGWRTVCAVEWEPYAASVLAARQNDGFLPAFPIWDDVRTFDGHPWRGLVDVVSGGFPCQDISNSGHKVGILGERSGLWREMARIVGEVRPRYVFVENVAALLSRGMGAVLADLAELGFDAQWRVLGTGDIGGVQTRERLWIVANAQGIGRESVFEKLRLLQATSAHRPRLARDRCLEYASDSNGVLRPTKPGLVRVADGMADRMDRIRATGNGQDPLCAATAWRLLTGDIAE